jgi:hypothetical protein
MVTRLIQFTLSLLCIFSIVAMVFGSAELHLWLGVGLGTFGFLFQWLAPHLLLPLFLPRGKWLAIGAVLYAGGWIALWFLYWAVDPINADSRGLTGGLLVLANTAFVVGLACRLLWQVAGHLWRQRAGTSASVA